MKQFLIVLLIVFLAPFLYSKDDHDHDQEKGKEKTVQTQKVNPAKHEHSESEKHTDKEHEHEEDEDKAHAEGDNHEEHGAHEDHGDEHADTHGEEHAEENSQVGPDKGILEANEENGIKLSSEAEKNFEVEKIAVSNLQSITISKKAIVTSGVEVNIYRYRNGFYKRIDFVQISKNENSVTMSSKDLAKGDFIVTKGLGFILIAEIAAFGGAPEGHSH